MPKRRKTRKADQSTPTSRAKTLVEAIDVSTEIINGEVNSPIKPDCFGTNAYSICNMLKCTEYPMEYKSIDAQHMNIVLKCVANYLVRTNCPFEEAMWIVMYQAVLMGRTARRPRIGFSIANKLKTLIYKLDVENKLGSITQTLISRTNTIYDRITYTKQVIQDLPIDKPISRSIVSQHSLNLRAEYAVLAQMEFFKAGGTIEQYMEINQQQSIGKNTAKSTKCLDKYMEELDEIRETMRDAIKTVTPDRTKWNTTPYFIMVEAANLAIGTGTLDKIQDRIQKRIEYHEQQKKNSIRRKKIVSPEEIKNIVEMKTVKTRVKSKVKSKMKSKIKNRILQITSITETSITIKMSLKTIVEEKIKVEDEIEPGLEYTNIPINDHVIEPGEFMPVIVYSEPAKQEHNSQEQICQEPFDSSTTESDYYSVDDSDSSLPRLQDTLYDQRYIETTNQDYQYFRSLLVVPPNVNSYI